MSEELIAFIRKAYEGAEWLGKFKDRKVLDNQSLQMM